MKIISKRRTEESVTYSRSFEYEDKPGAGFGFDCNELGAVHLPSLNPCARANFDQCMTGFMDIMRGQEHAYVDGELTAVPGTGHKVRVRMLDKGVRIFRRSYTHPAVGQCECGTHVELHGFTNTCERCGRDYNSAGQMLAPRSQWGEETGESAQDILMADVDPWGGE